jgi:APA family basic amino acid/polyamine antiporter
MSADDPRDRLPRVLSLWDASMLIVASVVGSGIFLTPARVAGLLPSAGWILLAWLAGALISLAGALTNAELGAMYPRAGGDYVYLREGVHPAAGFLVGGLSFFAIYAGTIAALAVVLGEAVAGAWGLGRAGVVGAAAGVIVACSLLNLRGARWGARFNNLASVAKILALVVFVALGPLLGEGSFEPWRSPPPSPEGGAWLRFGQALSPILFSYLGWNASVYVASEIRDPSRNVPRSLFLGLGLCATLYLVVNGVYLYALDPVSLQGSPDTGEAAARALFGSLGGRLVAGFVLLSVLGTLNATILIGPRIVYAMALDGTFLRRADRVHGRFQTPSAAIGVQAVVALALVVFLESFPRALDFTVFGIVLATSADVVALFALRIRRPEHPRPFRAWGHPWLPAVYLAVNVAIGGAIAFSRPRECAITLAGLAVALLVYGAIARQGRKASVRPRA